MSIAHRLSAALASIFASLATVAPCAAQELAEPPLNVDVIDLGAEPGRDVPYELRSPDGAAVVASSCQDLCDIPPGWWRGPGRYVFVARDGDASATVALELHGDEHHVRIDVVARGAVTVSARVDAADATVHARFIAPAEVGDPWLVEVDNPTDIPLTHYGQGAGVHWELEPTETDWTAEEWGARMFHTQGWCPTGIRPVNIPAHATTRLVLARPPRVVPPGSYRGLLRAREDRPGQPPHVIAFSIEVVADASAPAGVRFTAGR